MPREHPDWKRIRQNVKGSDWRHTSGWEVTHCGHPTALWPFYLTGPGWPDPVVSFNGMGFKSLAVAKAVAERVSRGELVPTTDRGVPRVLVDAFGDPAPEEVQA